MADWEKRKEYWGAVTGIAQSAFDEHEDEEDQDDHLVYSVDSNEWVIYTAGNIGVLRFSDADLEDAIEDFGWEGLTEYGKFTYAEMLMRSASVYLLSDAREALQRLRDEADED